MTCVIKRSRPLATKITRRDQKIKFRYERVRMGGLFIFHVIEREILPVIVFLCNLNNQSLQDQLVDLVE